jgi:hypothetical protein
MIIKKRFHCIHDRIAFHTIHTIRKFMNGYRFNMIRYLSTTEYKTDTTGKHRRLLIYSEHMSPEEYSMGVN